VKGPGSAVAAYERCTSIAGPLMEPRSERHRVEFRLVASRRERAVLTLLVGASALTGIALVGWLLLPWHVPSPGVVGTGGPLVTAGRVGFLCVVLVEIIRLVQSAAIWTFARRAYDPTPMTPPPGLRVAVLTTIVPAKEPVHLVARTLRAMRELSYDGVVDVWILDEGDDPRVRAVARSLGVKHFTRKGRSEYNHRVGEFRACTKAGNHNAWRAEHEHEYDVVAQMDPDHVPLPSFLERTLGYFRDPDIAFVVAPQVYGNAHQGLVSHGAAVQGYLFTGIVQRGGNGLDAPLLIGTNHLYRPAAWRQIGGYQDSIIEDHLTSMNDTAAVNEQSGNRWKGVFTPDILAIGEGPNSWTDYFNQQKRWAYGVWEIVLRRAPALAKRLTRRQRLSYGLAQSFYPSVGVTWVLGNLATGLYLLFGVTSVALDMWVWLALWGGTYVTWFTLLVWLRRFNLAEHERRESALPGLLLALFAGPVYVAAGFAALLGRPLAYAVTAKGELRSADSLRTFHAHLLWAVAAGLALAASAYRGHTYPALRAWAVLTLFAAVAPPVLGFGRRLSERRASRLVVSSEATRP